MIQARGYSHSCQILKLARESASLAVMAALGLKTASSVHHLVCVHSEDGVPVQLEDRYVNAQLAPEPISSSSAKTYSRRNTC